MSNNESKDTVIEQIKQGYLIKGLETLKGILFSEITLNNFIQEERVHGQFKVKTITKNALKNSSQGERKQALLEFVIKQNPDYIILDNVLGNLDANAQSRILHKLKHIGSKVLLVQLTNRSDDILPFIKTLYKVNNNVLKPFKKGVTGMLQETSFINALPQPDAPFNALINPIVKFTNVSVSYLERPILNGINWEIKTGEFWHLIGPNGSGKSTILSMIFGENPKAFGQNILLFGNKKGSGESVWDIKRKIGYFSSDMLLGFTRLDSVGNMIVSGFFDTIGLYKTPTNTQIKIAQQWLEVLGMSHIKTKDFLALSNGHQRLVLIARAMVKHPPLLILDEPTNGLDDHDANLFCQLINKIARETQTAILYVSHRKEKTLLNPDFIYELVPEKTGSLGRVIKQ